MATKKIKFKKFGWQKDNLDARDLKYSPPMGLESLPSMIDLRPLMPPVYDQKELGSCTANAIAADLEYNAMKQGRPAICPSRLFIYYNERIIENTVNSDAGAQLRDGIKALVRWGFCPETDWAYDITKFAKKPPVKIYRDAVKSKISKYYSIHQNLNDMKGCLNSGNAFFFGFSVYESFESDEMANTGMMPMAMPNEQLLGGHATTIVGFDDAKQVFIVRNSWGENWADKGYFYMPYNYILDPNLASDFWTITYVP